MTSLMTMTSVSPPTFFSNLSRRTSETLSFLRQRTEPCTFGANPKVALSGLPFKSLLQVRAIFVPLLERQLDTVTTPIVVFNSTSDQWEERVPSLQVQAARAEYLSFLQSLDTEAERRLNTYVTTDAEAARLAADPAVRPLFQLLYSGKEVELPPLSLDGLGDYTDLWESHRRAEATWHSQEQSHILNNLIDEVVSGYDTEALRARLKLLWTANEQRASAIERSLETTEDPGAQEALRQAESVCATATVLLYTLLGRCDLVKPKSDEEKETYANLQDMDPVCFSTMSGARSPQALAEEAMSLVSKSIEQVNQLYQDDLIED